MAIAKRTIQQIHFSPQAQTEEKVIRALLKARGNTLDIWQLSRRCSYMPAVIESVERLEKAGVLTFKDSNVHLKTKKRLPAYELKKEPPLKEVMKRFRNLRKQRLFPDDDEYDQLPITLNAVEKKLSVMLRNNDLLNRDIACLGDNDMFSVACSLTRLPRSISVFEKDKRVVAFLQKASQKLPVSIRVVQANIARPLPARYHDSFDVCISEPPDTVRGMFAFLRAALQGLRKEGVLYIGMSESALGKERWLQIEQAITQAGMRLTDIIQDFEEHVLDGEDIFAWKGFDKLPNWITKPPQKPWFVSALLRGELVGQKNTAAFSGEDAKEDFLTNHFVVE